MAGCLGLFIFIGIIGAIGSTFGGEWAALVVCILICLGFWANNEEQKEKEEQTTKLPINKSTDITIYNANKRTVEYKVATSNLLLLLLDHKFILIHQLNHPKINLENLLIKLVFFMKIQKEI
ncbi:hypothetical protein KZ479_07630 [Glaesserella parasuis]|nr:hypothetical protein [Glaesserella parasuis]